MHEHDSQPVPSTHAGPNALDQALAFIESMQGELDRLREQLAWSDRLSTLGTLSAGLAHEYNNLLTPVLSYAQMALKDPGNRALNTKALETAVKCINEARQLSDATLGFASPNQSGDTDNRCALDQVVRQVLDYLRPSLERDKIQVTAEVAVAAIAIDALAMKQILTNLIRNAQDAMRGDTCSKRLKIKAKTYGSEIELTVEDTGRGVEPGMLEQIFEPFVTCQDQPAQPQNSGSGDIESNESGTGLGLSICKDLITSAGGSIAAYSGPDEGTRFSITLPIASREDH